jgi:hypothetical protein
VNPSEEEGEPAEFTGFAGQMRVFQPRLSPSSPVLPRDRGASWLLGILALGNKLSPQAVFLGLSWAGGFPLRKLLIRNRQASQRLALTERMVCPVHSVAKMEGRTATPREGNK